VCVCVFICVRADKTLINYSLFGCDNKYVDYALPDVVNLINLGGRVMATRVDGGFVVEGLTASVHYGTNSDVAIELIFNNPISIVGVAFPHVQKVYCAQLEIDLSYYVL